MSDMMAGVSWYAGNGIGGSEYSGNFKSPWYSGNCFGGPIMSAVLMESVKAMVRERGLFADSVTSTTVRENQNLTEERPMAISTKKTHLFVISIEDIRFGKCLTGMRFVSFRRVLVSSWNRLSG